MARVLLISYPGYPSTPRQLAANHQLASMAGALLAAGHQVRVLDYGTVAMMRRLFPRELTRLLQPVAAGLLGGGGQAGAEQLAQLQRASAQLEAHQVATEAALAEEVVAEARSWQPDLAVVELGDTGGYGGTMQIARRLREEFPRLHLSASGRKACWFRGLILETAPALDTLIYGDPEPALVGLAEVSESRRETARAPGMIYRSPAGPVAAPCEPDLDLNELPLPVYDEAVYPAMAGDQKIRLILVTESRGCGNRCAFCVHPWEDGVEQRLATPRHVVETMAALQRRYGFSVFSFSGSSTPGDLMSAVAREILDRGLQVQYSSFGHFRNVQPDNFQMLAQSGLYSIFFGLESGCQEILDRAVHKGIELASVAATVRAAREAGIFIATSMIVPLPFDTPETLAESLAFVKGLQPDAVPLQFPGLMPGTRWFRDPARYNLDLPDADQFLRGGLDYKIKLLFPPQFWEPLGYRVNGLDFGEFTAVTMSFAGELEAAGILTNFSHTLAAIAHAARLPARQLRDLARLWCVTGDAASMGEMVGRANAAMIRGSQSK